MEQIQALPTKPRSPADAASLRASLIAAIFMMATSAIGPGFITQTATFTVTLGAAFAFGILASILIDFVVQMNIWRIVVLTRKRAADIANEAIPGSGYLLAVLVIFGGLVFNIGNIAGTGLGLNALVGLDPKWGGLLSAVVAIGLFTSKRAGVALDRVVVFLGVLMIGMTLFVAWASGPPVGEALRQTVWPDVVDFAAITTIVGGTVGGYITYAGAHRLLDRGTVGIENLEGVTRGALGGIFVTGVMRFVLFLAILGVVAGGATIQTSGQAANPAAQAFQAAAGEIGLRVFGLILWAAAITSVIGASYTTVSFLTSRTGTSEGVRTALVCGFIAVTTLVFVVVGTAPTTLLVFAGAFNGLLLPFGIGVLLWVATRRADLLRGYAYPRWLLGIGWTAWLLTLYLAVRSVRPVIDLFA